MTITRDYDYFPVEKLTRKERRERERKLNKIKPKYRGKK